MDVPVGTHVGVPGLALMCAPMSTGLGTPLIVCTGSGVAAISSRERGQRECQGERAEVTGQHWGLLGSSGVPLDTGHRAPL